MVIYNKNNHNSILSTDGPIPDGYTDIKPLADKDGFNQKFDGVNWQYVSDVQYYSTVTGLPVDVHPGQLLTGLTDQKPGEGQQWSISFVKWIDSRENLVKKLTEKYNRIQNEQIKTLTADYPDEITKTFDKQDREARAYTADNLTKTPLLDSIALSRQIDKNILVGKIILKSDAYTQAIGNIIGVYDKLKEEISSLTDDEIYILIKGI